MHSSKSSLFDEAEVSQKSYDPLSKIYETAKVLLSLSLSLPPSLPLSYEIAKVFSACERVSSRSTSSDRRLALHLPVVCGT